VRGRLVGFARTTVRFSNELTGERNEREESVSGRNKIHENSWGGEKKDPFIDEVCWTGITSLFNY
jgi:hypothetical protein